MRLIASEQVLAEVRGAFGLDASKEGHVVDEALLATLLRAVAWSNCPCQPFMLVREVERQLKGLVDESEALREGIAAVLETLIATGDLVEPGEVSHAIELPKGTLFAAPLSFAMLTDGIAQIFGIAGVNALESRPELQQRLVHEGSSRRVYARPSERLKDVLLHAGLREMSVQAWLKEPGAIAPGAFLHQVKATLKHAGPADSAAEGLEVLETALGRLYVDCWRPASSHHGLHVARRPKAFGNTHWMLVEMFDGRVARVAHLPPAGSTHRACDEAWRVQLALDAMNGRHQRFRRRKEGGDGFIDLLFPLPQWAHRHILVMGRQVPRHRSICSYQVPANLLPEVCSFLEQKLWMKTTD